MAVSDMSTYELSAFTRLTETPPSSRSLIPQRARELGSRVGRAVQSGAARMPGNEVIADAYAAAAKALMSFTTGSGMHSVTLGASMRRHRRSGHEVDRPEDFLQLDLRQCDQMLPNRKVLHQAVALAEGAAASVLITGTTVSSTVSGGTTAAVALGTVATDSVLVMAGLGRVVGEVAVTYGFDPNLPEEELFALQVLGLGLATESGAKAAALTSLSRLTQDMMRRATWTQLNEHVLVEIIQRAFATLGLRLTQKKLAQIVPVAGVVVSSGVNLQLLDRVHKAAIQAYRPRFLTVKYGLSTSVSTELSVPVAQSSDAEQVIRIDEMLDDAFLATEDTRDPAAEGESSGV